MVMRVGGIVSGMDIEAMVEKLMEAERMPLVRMKQEETRLTWKRDAFREINNVLLQLDEMILELKLSRTYNPKIATSSQENAVRATASSTAANGSYEIAVSQLASNEMQISSNNIAKDADLSAYVGTHVFYTYNEDGGQEQHTLTIEENDTIQTVMNKVRTASDGRVRAFYDENSGQVVLETTRTGVYNENGAEITFGEAKNGDETIGNFFTDFLQMGQGEGNYKQATNAIFTYNNGLTLTSRENSYTINGITFEFLDVTEGSNARITVSSDVETSFEAIKNFVEKYNEAIEMMNKSQTEQRYRDYHPLSEEEKAEMTERQIELWEERAKSGILRGEAAIRDSMYALRQSLQSVVDTGGEYTLLSQIGIKTTENYLDGGKLTIDEEALKEALRDNPEDVYRLFTADGDGLIHRFDSALDQARGRIEIQAGRETSVALDSYSIGRRLKELNERISDFEKRMIQVEQRYWAQFTQMEKAIARLSEQSSFLFSQFGGY